MSLGQGEGEGRIVTHWLVYWKTYWDEVDDPSELEPDWNTSFDHMYEQADKGDTIWVVISGGPDREQEWRLLERFQVESKHTSEDVRPPFRYRLDGAIGGHEVYDPIHGNDLTHILQSLNFESDQRIPVVGRKIGQWLQSPRRLSNLDAKKLASFAEMLPNVTK